MNAVVVRRAGETDVDRILDLLTHYDQPREAFEPWYESDPAYRPEHSWLVEDGDALVAHVRIYPRRLRIGPDAGLLVAGIGNVVTARTARGQGHADRAMRAAVRAAAEDGYAYSLLWTHLPGLYARHGYGATVQDETCVTVPPAPVDIPVRRAEPRELPALAELQEAFDAHRQGTGMRDLAFWRASARWLCDEILVSTSDAEAPSRVTGYVRRRVDGDVVTVLELGAPVDDPATGHALLAAAAAPAQGRIRAILPPSLRAQVAAWGPAETPTTALMGRALSFPALAEALSAAWSPRLARDGREPELVVPVESPDGAVGLRVSLDGVETVPAPPDVPPLDPGALTTLLLRGCDETALGILGTRPDVEELTVVAPADDFVLWQTDAF